MDDRIPPMSQTGQQQAVWLGRRMLGKILSTTGAGYAGIYENYSDSGFLTPAAAWWRQDFPAPALRPFFPAESVEPPAGQQAGQWVEVPSQVLIGGPALPPLHVFPLRLTVSRRQYLLLSSPGPAALTLDSLRDQYLCPPRRRAWLRDLDRMVRRQDRRNISAVLQDFRASFFMNLSVTEALTTLLEGLSLRMGISAPRIGIGSDSPASPPVEASYDDFAPAVRERLNDLVRASPAGMKPEAALTEIATGDRLPGWKACRLNLRMPSARISLLVLQLVEKPWTPGLLLTLRKCLEGVALFLAETAPLGNKIQAHSRRQETEQAIQGLLKLRDLEEFHHEAPQVLRSMLGVESLACYFCDWDNRRLWRQAYAGNASAYNTPWDSRAIDDASWLGNCALTGQALLKSGLSAKDQTRVRDRGDFTSLIYHPIKVDGRVMGIVKAADSRPGAVNFSHLQRLSEIEPFLILAMRNSLQFSRLRHKVHLDPETGLLNRPGFEDKLRQCLTRSHQRGESLSVMMVSVDRPDRLALDAPNETRPQLTEKISGYLRKNAPPGASLAHFGELVFSLLTPRSDLETSLNQARLICRDVRAALWTAACRPTFSIGISSFPLNGVSVDELMLSAEQAMTISRFQGGDTASLLGSEIIKKLALNILAGMIGQVNFKMGPELVDGVLERISAGPQPLQPLSELEMINSLAEAIDAKDHYTGNHTLETSILAVALGRKMGLDEKVLERLRIAAKLHDIGKIGVPESILLKKGKLSDEEREIIRKHPEIGAKILRPIATLQPIAVIVEHHHERWDGTGYPHRLKGLDIPVESRILAIIDSYHAMISQRNYHDACSFQDAIAEIEREAGRQFDPQLVRMFVEMMMEKQRFAGEGQIDVPSTRPPGPYM